MRYKFFRQTVGLVTYEHFKSVQENLELNEAKALLAKTEEQNKLRAEKHKQMKSKVNMKKLSFSMYEEEEDSSSDENEVQKTLTANSTSNKRNSESTSEPISPSSSIPKSTSPLPSFESQESELQKALLEHKKDRTMMKDPTVNTSFLPDEDREIALAAERARLGKEYEELTAQQKRRKLDVTYSLWDGSGHRRTVTIEQGATVGEFLRRVLELEHSQKNYRFASAWSIQDVMLVKEDVILPQHITFHELIVDRARGKSGPLYNWDVHDDVRLENDARIEKDESHPAKVVDRHWYEQNKHIFPVNRWEHYDPNRTYDSYTIADRHARQREEDHAKETQKMKESSAGKTG